MAVRVTQTSYNAGELGELMVGRVDDTRYAAGLRTCKNALITPQGPVKNRSGFQFVAETKYADKPTVLIPFTYSTDQTLIIELGHYYARFHTEGQTLLNASGTAPYEIATPWDSEDVFSLHYTQNADVMTIVHPKYKPRELRRYSMTDWRIVDVNLVTTLTAPSGVTATRKTEAVNDDNAEKYTQTYVVTALNADRSQESVRSAQASVTANLYATGTTVGISWGAVSGATYYRVYKLQGGIFGFIGETTTTHIVDDNIAPETGQTPPYVDDVFKVSKGITSVRVVSGGSGYGETKHITGVSNSCDWEFIPHSARANYGTLPVRVQGKANLTWAVNDTSGSGADFSLTVAEARDWDADYEPSVPMASVTNIKLLNGGSGYDNPELEIRCHNRKWEYVGSYIFPLTTAVDVPELVVEDPTGYGAVLKPVVQNGTITSVTVVYPGTNYTNPTVRVVSPLGGGSGASFTCSVADAGDYPSAVGYFEQRRIFAGTRLRPQQIWMTATGTESNMTYHLPLQDTDRISFAVASRDLNMIQHVVPLQQLIMLTSAAEWRVSPLNSDALTPSSISVRPQAYIGASEVQPHIVNTNLLYAASRGSHIRELAFNYQAGGYTTGDISIRAPHLFSEEKPVTNMALSKSPDPYLWCVRKDGVMLGLCYVPEQNIGAWFQFQTAGSFESAAVVQEGAYDYLYAVVTRPVGSVTKRFIERQTIRQDAERNGCFLDCSGHFMSNTAASTIRGLTWLEGATVSVLADGAVYSGLVVKDSAITLPIPVTDAWIGLPYETVIETLPVTLQAQDGSYGRGHVKNVNRVIMRVYRTSGIEAGPDEDHMRPVAARTNEPIGSAPVLQTGEIDVGAVGVWKSDGSFRIRQADPLPFTLIYHSADVEIGG